MRRVLKIFVLMSAGLFIGCQTTISEPTETFGTAVRQNIAAQTVEPTPEQKQNTYIRPDSQRMAIARDRYRKDEVETPVDLRTTAED